MGVKMDSLSSSLMLGTTLYRNQPGFSNKLVGQVGYALVALVSAVESCAALAFVILSLTVYSVYSAPAEHAVQWFISSSFSLGWSVVDFFFNPFVPILVADEGSALQMFLNRDLVRIPHNALLTL